MFGMSREKAADPDAVPATPTLRDLRPDPADDGSILIVGVLDGRVVAIPPDARDRYPGFVGLVQS